VEKTAGPPIPNVLSVKVMVKGAEVMPLADSSRSITVGDPPETSAVLTLIVQPSVKLALKVVAPYWGPPIEKLCAPEAAVKLAFAIAADAVSRNPPAIAIFFIIGLVFISCLFCSSYVFMGLSLPPVP